MSRKLLNLGLTVFVLALFTIISSASGESRFLPCDTDCAELETQAESEPTESPQSSRDLNPVMISDASVTFRPFDMGLGGYVDPEIHPYRDVIEGDTVVLDYVGGSDQQFGLITLEALVGSQRQLEFPETKLMYDGTYKPIEEVMQAGIREFYIQGYMQAYDLDPEDSASRARAEQMLANNEPIPFTWFDNDINKGSWTRQIRPSEGVSFILLDQPVSVTPNGSSEFRGVVTSYWTGTGDTPAYQYGFEVTENGRLILLTYRGGETSIDQTTALMNVILDALRTMNGDHSPSPVWHTAYEKVDEYMREVTAEFGLGHSTLEEDASISDWEAVSLVRVKFSLA